MKVNSTMSETKAAFAERTIRSLKNILYRYMENYVCKYVHKSPLVFAAMVSRDNRSIDINPIKSRPLTLC